MVGVVARRGCGARAVGMVTSPGVVMIDGMTLVTAGIVIVGTENRKLECQ